MRSPTTAHHATAQSRTERGQSSPADRDDARAGPPVAVGNGPTRSWSTSSGATLLQRTHDVTSMALSIEIFASPEECPTVELEEGRMIEHEHEAA